MKVVSEIWNCEFEISEIGKLERNWEVGGNWKFRKKFGREEEYARGFWKNWNWGIRNWKSKTELGMSRRELRGQGSFRNLEMELRQRGNWSPAGIVETRGWRLKPEIVFEMD